MKTIILEGIATSGKSTITNLLIKALPTSLRILVKDESSTHVPIMEDIGDTHVDFFKNLILEASRQQVDVIIFDRLYVTQAFRSKSNLNHYAEVDEVLLPINPMTILLKVDEMAVANRVAGAAVHRDPSWREYLSTKGGNIDDVASYYIEQQRSLIELIRQSKIPYKIFDTTNHDYAGIVTYLQDFIKV